MMEGVFVNVKNRSLTITADVETPQATTANGTIIAQGGRFGGWSLYVKDGVPAYEYNFLGLRQTRIAASEPSVWRDILISNRQAMLEQLDHYQQALNAFEAALIAEDAPALRELIASASAARADWRLGQGPCTD